MLRATSTRPKALSPVAYEMVSTVTMFGSLICSQGRRY
jgi:hypothetical protein